MEEGQAADRHLLCLSGRSHERPCGAGHERVRRQEREDDAGGWNEWVKRGEKVEKYSGECEVTSSKCVAVYECVKVAGELCALYDLAELQLHSCNSSIDTALRTHRIEHVASVRLFRERDAEALGHAVERAAIDSHHLGGARAVVADLFEHVQQIAALDLFERRQIVEQPLLERRRARRDRWRQIAEVDRGCRG